MTIKVSLEELIKSGAHFGHQTRRWNPKMEPFLYAKKDGVHVFDLITTKKLLEEALIILEDASKKEKKILFVGTKKQAKENIRKIANETGNFFVDERWLGGTLTNFPQIKKSIDKLADMKLKLQKGEYKNFTKKERLLKEREISRLERFFGGLAGIKELPDLLVIVDARREKGALQEAIAKNIEAIGIVDSNSNPTLVIYPIPINDAKSKKPKTAKKTPRKKNKSLKKKKVEKK